MSYWYEVFDNEQVQFITRKQAGQLGVLVLCTIGATLVALWIGSLDAVPAGAVGAFVAVVWLATTWWVAKRLRRLRRVVWCVKISDHRIVGFDYHRRKTTLDWLDVVRIELIEQGLVVVGPPPCTLEIPHLFPEFATLSHRITSYAELYNVPIYLHGQPFQDLDVHALYPFLTDACSTGATDPH